MDASPLRRLFVVVFALALILVPAVAVQAQQIEQVDPEFYFAQNSSSCGDYAPIDPVLQRRTNGERFQVSVTFTITEAQINAAECAGSHFDLQIRLTGFDSFDDWSGCSVKSSHSYIIGKDVRDGGNGTAVATIYGAKLTENRLNPGDEFWAKVDCRDMWPSDDEIPSVSVEYVGTWWSTDLNEPGCEATDFVTSGTKGPAGLPVCVEYTGQTAQLVDSDWGDTEFPFWDNE